MKKILIYPYFLSNKNINQLHLGLFMTTPNFEFVVDHNKCFGCGACIALCPTNALDLIDMLAEVNQESCTYCNHCIPSCPVFALKIEEIPQ